MTDPYDLTARLAAIRNRIAARLPGVPGVSLEIGPSADEPVAVLVLFGDVVHATVMLDQCETDDEIIAEALDIIADDGFAVLPEIVLTEDAALTLAGHSLRIAETQTGVSARARPPVDHSHGYTAEMGEADLARVAMYLAHAYMEGIDDERSARLSPDDDVRHYEERYRGEAALLLSKLKGWQRGAPPESPGHAYARAVHDGASPSGDRIPETPAEQRALDQWIMTKRRRSVVLEQTYDDIGPWSHGVRTSLKFPLFALGLDDGTTPHPQAYDASTGDWIECLTRDDVDEVLARLYPSRAPRAAASPATVGVSGGGSFAVVGALPPGIHSVVGGGGAGGTWDAATAARIARTGTAGAQVLEAGPAEPRYDSTYVDRKIALVQTWLRSNVPWMSGCEVSWNASGLHTIRVRARDGTIITGELEVGSFEGTDEHTIACVRALVGVEETEQGDAFGMPGLRSFGPIMLDGKPHDEYGRELPDEDEP